MSVQKYFDSNVFDLGRVKETDVLDFNFEFKGTSDDLHYISTSCGSCTDAWYDEESNMIKGTFAPAMSQSFTEQLTTLNKNVYVYIDKEVQEFIAQGEGRKRVRNPDKKILTLTLKAVVEKVKEGDDGE